MAAATAVNRRPHCSIVLGVRAATAATHTGSGLLSRDMMALLPCLATILLMASARILSFI